MNCFFFWQITCDNVGSTWYTALGGVKHTQTQCKKDYCECDKAMVNSVYKEITENGEECPTKDVACGGGGKLRLLS